MARPSGIQLVDIKALSEVNDSLQNCIDICEKAIESAAGKKELPCKNFKQAVKGWGQFRAFVQFMAGAANTAKVDLETNAIAISVEKQSRGSVKTTDAKNLVAAMKSYLALVQTATSTCQKNDIKTLDAQNFRQALEGCASFAQFARSLAGSLHVQPILDAFVAARGNVFITAREKAEIKRARTAANNLAEEFFN